ncbi:11361_t:CDS:2, partial [Funneliformis mosseae]
MGFGSVKEFNFKFLFLIFAMEDNKNRNDQLIQDFERKLKVQQQNITQRNPYIGNEQRFKLISPMFDMVMNQVSVISSCFTVHARIAFTEKEKRELSKEITEIPQQLSEILFESAKIRRNLIDIIGAMERLSNGIARFMKIANNPKLQDKPLTKYLHFVEKPIESLNVLLNKKCELDTEKVENLKNNLDDFMKISGSQAIPGWVEEQAQCKKELEALEKERQEKLIEVIAEFDEVARIIGEIEFYKTKSDDHHERLKKDLLKEKEMLQKSRDYLESQALSVATSTSIVRFIIRNKDLEVLRKQKMLIKEELSEIASQENKEILDEAECKKELASLWKKLEAAKDKVEQARAKKNEQLEIIDEKIKKKREEVKEFENKILNMLKDYGNPSISATCLMLESIASLTKQQTQGTGIFDLYRKDVKNFLVDIENEIITIKNVEGDRDLLEDEWVRPFETTEAESSNITQPPVVTMEVDQISETTPLPLDKGKAKTTNT